MLHKVYWLGHKCTHVLYIFCECNFFTVILTDKLVILDLSTYSYGDNLQPCYLIITNYLLQCVILCCRSKYYAHLPQSNPENLFT